MKRSRSAKLGGANLRASPPALLCAPIAVALPPLDVAAGALRFLLGGCELAATADIAPAAPLPTARCVTAGCVDPCDRLTPATSRASSASIFLHRYKRSTRVQPKVQIGTKEGGVT